MDLVERYTTLRHTSPTARPVEVRVTARQGIEAAPAVVLVHGFKGFMHWGFMPELAARLARAGFTAIAYNASHNGVSATSAEASPRWDVIDDDEAFAANTHTQELADLALVRRWIADGGVATVDVTRVGLMGHSRGGGIVTLSAAADPAPAVVLWAPIDEADRVDAATKRMWRETGHLAVPNARTGQVHHLGLDILDEVEARRPELDIAARAGDVTCPVLLVHGTADGSVPHQASSRLAATLPRAELVLLEGADHAFGATHPMPSVTPIALEQAFAASVGHFVRHLVGR
jgi:dienelactone hydrolase